MTILMKIELTEKDSIRPITRFYCESYHAANVAQILSARMKCMAHIESSARIWLTFESGRQLGPSRNWNDFYLEPMTEESIEEKKAVEILHQNNR